jgi:hypothetical protein
VKIPRGVVADEPESDVQVSYREVCQSSVGTNDACFPFVFPQRKLLEMNIGFLYKLIQFFPAKKYVGGHRMIQGSIKRSEYENR